MAETTKPRAKGKSNTLTLDIVKLSGGTQEDLELLADIDDAEDEEFPGLVIPADREQKPIRKEEITNFIKELGLSDYKPEEETRTKKPKKLLTAPVDEDDSATTSQTAPTEKKQKKKKEKNRFKTGEEKDPDSQHRSASQSESGEPKKKKEEKNFKIQHNEISSSTGSGEEELLSHLKTSPQRPYLLVKPGDTWLDGQVADSAAEETTKSLVRQCEQFAAKLLEDEVSLYKRQREKNKRGDSQWIKTVLSSGTLSDKMAALMVLVQESAAHNMSAFDTLVNMARKKGKREAMLASDTLKNLFTSETSPLPDDRKLIAFDARPFSSLWRLCSGNRDSVDRRLMVWYAEDLLRQKYAAFVKALDVMSYDTLLASKEKALAILHSLLTSKPEQENVLLPMLVNKLGDPNHKIASKASYLLIKLVEEHPNMKSVIVGEVERLIYRPNVTERAQYYALCFLNQVKLHKADHPLASQLITIYFTFFKVYVKKGEADSKMMAALLTGVNRAYPYAKAKREFLTEQVGTLYRLVHMVNFNTSVQALMLLHHVTDPSTSDSDRFFMALYRKLLDPGLRTSAKQPQFLNLLYKSMKADVVDKRVLAFLKRLLQTASLLDPSFLCGALIIISEVLKERPHLLRIKKIGNMAADTNLDQEDDEEERFVDLPLPPEFQDSNPIDSAEHARTEDAHTEEDAKPDMQKQQGGSWLHRQNLTDHDRYDRFQRNPLYSHAQNECLFELQALTQHFHPSVKLFATTLLNGGVIQYPSNPLEDFTFIRFLDRFVYKNPKKREAVEARSATVGTGSRKRQPAPEQIPVNSAEFLQRGEAAVPEHEQFFFRYFQQKAEERKKKEEEEDSDVDSVDDDEFDNFLDKHERQYDDDDLGDLDFTLDLPGKEGKKKKGGKGKANKQDSSDDDDKDDDMDGDDDDDLDGLSDDELAAAFREEMEGLGDMEDAEDDFDDDGEFSDDELKQMMVSRKRGIEDDEPDEAKPKKKKSKGGLESIFASADDFADILESSEDAGLASAGTGDAMLVNDKASAKQIAWERKRNQHSYRNSRRDKKRQGGRFAKGGHKKKRKV